MSGNPFPLYNSAMKRAIGKIITTLEEAKTEKMEEKNETQTSHNTTE